MIKRSTYWLIALLLFSAISSCGERKIELSSCCEHSGYGYANGLCFQRAEVEFLINNPKSEEVSSVIRCRAMHLNDAGESLIMVVNGTSFPLTLEPTLDWQLLHISIPLKEGNNLILFRKTRELFYDICIDYLEL